MVDETFLPSQDDLYIEEANSVDIGNTCQPDSIPLPNRHSQTEFRGLQCYDPDILSANEVTSYLEQVKVKLWPHDLS